MKQKKQMNEPLVSGTHAPAKDQERETTTDLKVYSTSTSMSENVRGTERGGGKKATECLVVRLPLKLRNSTRVSLLLLLTSIPPWTDANHGPVYRVPYSPSQQKTTAQVAPLVWVAHADVYVQAVEGTKSAV